MTLEFSTAQALLRFVAIFATLLTIEPLSFSAETKKVPETRAAGARSPSDQSFSIEQALDFPYPEETSLVASPKGERIAWVENRHGVRNIVAAEAPRWTPRQLTGYKDDDGQALTDLNFSGDGGLIVYLRGGQKNGAGESPDPDSNPAGAKQTIWKISWAGGTPRKVDFGGAPKVSPTSTFITGSIAYFKDGKLWIAPVGSGSPIEAFTQGADTDLDWRPDGKQIAFVSNRAGHSLIAIYDVEKRIISYAAPTVDRDTYPRWSPDGAHIAFVRSPISFGERRSNLTAPDSPKPWAIWIYDTHQLNAREAWHSGKEAKDSLPALPGNTLLSWSTSDTIVFSSEQDGWQHLYNLPASGGSPQLLTPGNCEYDYMTYSSDRRTIFYSANCQDIDRRHVWAVPAGGGTPQQITSGEGLEWWPVPVASGKWIAFLGSDAQRPAAPFVQTWPPVRPDEGKKRALTSLPNDFPKDRMVPPKQVILKAADGLEVHTQLFVPAGVAAGEKHPAIVHMHGGPLRQMLLGWHPMFYYSSAYALHQYMVSRGYIVIEVNYRSGIGYGEDFRMARGRGSRGATEYQDIVAAANYLRERSDVDSSRIGLWGGSYGGFLTAMGLARNSDIFAAGVDFHGVHDWTQRIGLVTGNSPMASSDPLAKVAHESSPVASISNWRSPVLLIQGDDDRNVDFGQLIELVPMLRRQGVDFEQLILPDEVHDFLRWDSWIRADHATSDFFDRKFKMVHIH